MCVKIISTLVTIALVVALSSTTFAAQKISVSQVEKQTIQEKLLQEIPASDRDKFEIRDITVIKNYASAYRDMKQGETDFCILKYENKTWKILDCGSGVFYDKSDWVKKGIPATLFDKNFKTIKEKQVEKPNTASEIKVPKLIGRVNDYAKVLSLNQAILIGDILANYEKKTTNQVTVLTVPTLLNEDINKFALRVGSTWGIGVKGKNNGVLLILASEQKKTRIEVGKGLQEKLTNDKAFNILNKKMRPHLKNGDFDQGFLVGVNAIIEAINSD